MMYVFRWMCTTLAVLARETLGFRFMVCFDPAGSRERVSVCMDVGVPEMGSQMLEKPQLRRGISGECRGLAR